MLEALSDEQARKIVFQNFNIFGTLSGDHIRTNIVGYTGKSLDADEFRYQFSVGQIMCISDIIHENLGKRYIYHT